MHLDSKLIDKKSELRCDILRIQSLLMSLRRQFSFVIALPTHFNIAACPKDSSTAFLIFNLDTDSEEFQISAHPRTHQLTETTAADLWEPPHSPKSGENRRE